MIRLVFIRGFIVDVGAGVSWVAGSMYISLYNGERFLNYYKVIDNEGLGV